MYPHLFDLRYLNSFGLCISIGLVLCFWVGRRYARVKGADPGLARFAEGNAYVAILTGFTVSVIAQSFLSYRADPSGGFRLGSAATFLGGLIGGVVSFVLGYLWLGRRKYGSRFVELLTIAPVCVTIAHAFGRLGCFFAGCCHGKPTGSFLGVQFPHLSAPVFPTQLFESGFLFLLFFLLVYLVFRRGFHQGFALYLLGYGLFRFFVEFLRGDERGAFVGALSPSQTLSLLLIFGSACVYLATERLLEAYRNDPTIEHRILA